MRIRSLAAGSAVLALAASGLVGSAADATPGLKTSTSPAVPLEYTLGGPLRARADGVQLKTNDDTAVRTFQLTYAAGGFSGWHQHPGIVFAVVLSGAVQRTVPCHRPQTFTAGQAFTEVGPHFVANLDAATTGVPAVLQITQIAPEGTTGPAFREDLPTPVCHRPHR